MDMETFGSPNSEVIRRLEEQHRHYSEKLENLVQKPYLSAEEEIEEVRLKKTQIICKRSDDSAAEQRRSASSGLTLAPLPWRRSLGRG